MAERRMFSRKILKGDAFMELPVSSRELYFQLCMDADDDGFVSNPRMTIRLCNANLTDLEILATTRFLIVFESGVVLIKHWWLHNELKRDRYKPTTYQDEKRLVLIKDNRVYSLEEGVPMEDWRQSGNTVSPQYRLGKDSIGKVSKEERDAHDKNFDKFWSIYPRKVAKSTARIAWNKHYFNEQELAKVLESVESYRKTKQWMDGFIPHPTTFLNQSRFNDEISTTETTKALAFKSYTK